jgi:ABC-type antimicrobial peptide transport system permease subunit
MSRWLNGFAYHIPFPLFVFPLSVFLVWAVALISTIGKTIALARINPVDVLRRE